MDKLMIEIQVVQKERKISLLETKFYLGFMVFFFILLSLVNVKNVMTLIVVCIPVIIGISYVFLKWVKSYIHHNYDLKSLKDQMMQDELRRKSWSTEGSFFVFRRD